MLYGSQLGVLSEALPMSRGALLHLNRTSLMRLRLPLGVITILMALACGGGSDPTSLEPLPSIAGTWMASNTQYVLEVNGTTVAGTRTNEGTTVNVSGTWSGGTLTLDEPLEGYSNRPSGSYSSMQVNVSYIRKNGTVYPYRMDGERVLTPTPGSGLTTERLSAILLRPECGSLPDRCSSR
jgi:hypothetical protein